MKPWYVGRFEFAVDKQRRLAVPRPWRDDKKDENQPETGGDRRETFLLLPDRRGCIMAIPGEAFSRWVDSLRTGAIGDPVLGEALAEIGFASSEVECDVQGRITIPEELMEHAGLRKGEKALLVGAVLSFLIWTPERWRQRKRPEQDPMALLARHAQSSSAGATMAQMLVNSIGRGSTTP